MEKTIDKKIIDEIIEKYKNPSGKVISILEDIQEKNKYLSKEALEYVSEKLNIPLSQLYSIATFYSFFNLKPVGKHIISVCTGTPCHVKGAPQLIKTLERLLGIKQDEVSEDSKFFLTTHDRSFSLTAARCFGCCSMAPVIRIDDKIYGYVTVNDLPKILKEYGWREK
ncbi:NADH dehydrogenase (quinone) [Desulfurobacterium thermolithotrophum DSM 11699]|uniref:NADH dehydrogenase (Quinone) n=1 Tax=Desulfurobacterium thermolithotrophum (strain DSM 11699 / BSA) TaxID=868864 RepID=F0S2J9_DESTD|nr:NAD(P)H-dependent oxidoreductase subunit E [Desulfurobacterium thermolithotrophum]ADY73071.1 NADH dehydrogenase (quinone) [Desulfurobacterium thermolithotrophum DSM 11699]